MPHLLRFDTVRLLESSQEALHLAVVGLGAQKRVTFRQSAAEFAIEVGLIGAAAELAMASCLVQAKGSQALLWPSGQYKTAGVVLKDFRDLVSEATAASAFLTDGVPDPSSHRHSLLSASESFRRLIPLRAAGLHAGRGLLHEAVVVQANVVAEFLSLLSASRRIHPYLESIPRCLWYGRDRVVLIEDLVARLAGADPGDRPSILSSIFLVLPDIPEEEPEWLDAFERVSIAPRERDVQFLLETLEDALPANLRRTNRAGAGVPVRVEPNDPQALPIAPHFLRRQFNEIPDLWQADIATANGRLNQGALDLPPLDAVVDVFALGLERAAILEASQNVTAHEAWPHVAASLDFRGTVGPYWFLVRRCDDLGQLRGLIEQAAALHQRLAQRLPEFCLGIAALQHERPLRQDEPEFSALIQELGQLPGDRMWLLERESQYSSQARALPEELHQLLAGVAEGGEPVGKLIEALLLLDCTPECLTYWPRILAELASEADDIPGLVAILGTGDTSAAHTAARRALRRIDFSLYGPPVEEPEPAGEP